MKRNSLITTISRSPFALALRKLLDETNLFSRPEWARYLGVSESAVSQWLNDKTLPRPDLLFLVFDTVRSRSGVRPELLLDFENLANRPSEEISPLGSRMKPTVWEYMAKRAFLGKELRYASPVEKELLLRHGSIGHNSPDLATESGDLEKTVLLVSVPKHGRQVFNERPILRSSQENPASGSFGSVLDPAFLPNLRDSSEPTAPRITWEMLLSQPKTLIIGAPGSGKSALITFLALRLKERRPTLLIRFPDWKAAGGSLRHVVENFCARGADAQRNAAWLQSGLLYESLSRPRVAILIDGIDEFLHENRARIIHDLRGITDHWPDVQLIAASRATTELQELTEFRNYCVLPLTSWQAITWMHKQLPASDLVHSAELERFVCHLSERRNILDFITPLFLETSSSLFRRSALTPFAETELVTSYVHSLIGEWDQRKGIVRTRESWASPQRLSAALEWISFNLVCRSGYRFTTQEAAQWLERFAIDAPAADLLRLLSEQSGIVEGHPAETWQISHRQFMNYFAARFLVTSCRDVAESLMDWAQHDQLRDVLRVASGLTSDATDLLRLVMRTSEATDSTKGLMLARMLAQPIIAEMNVLEESSRIIASWLDASLAEWRVTRNDSPCGRNCIWRVSAETSGESNVDNQIRRTMSLVHQARSGPAKESLSVELSRARAPVVRALGETLNVEGKFMVYVDESRGALSAEIATPDLA